MATAAAPVSILADFDAKQARLLQALARSYAGSVEHERAMAHRARDAKERAKHLRSARRCAAQLAKIAPRLEQAERRVAIHRAQGVAI